MLKGRLADGETHCAATHSILGAMTPCLSSILTTRSLRFAACSRLVVLAGARLRRGRACSLSSWPGIATGEESIFVAFGPSVYGRPGKWHNRWRYPAEPQRGGPSTRSRLSPMTRCCRRYGNNLIALNRRRATRSGYLRPTALALSPAPRLATGGVRGLNRWHAPRWTGQPASGYGRSAPSRYLGSPADHQIPSTASPTSTCMRWTPAPARNGSSPMMPASTSRWAVVSAPTYHEGMLISAASTTGVCLTPRREIVWRYGQRTGCGATRWSRRRAVSWSVQTGR